LLVLVIFLLWWNSQPHIRKYWMPGISYDLLGRQHETAITQMWAE
jgi:hypothetical protein